MGVGVEVAPTLAASSGAALSKSDQLGMARAWPPPGARSRKMSNPIKMTDRLRDLIDLVLGSLDEPGADGRALARRAHFSRDHLDRLLAAATGESPVALRRRLLLERAAWQLRAGAATRRRPRAPRATARSPRSRARSRARTGAAERVRGLGRPVELEAPNGIHFHAPAGLLIPARARTVPDPVLARDLSARLVAGHLARVRELLEAAGRLPAEALERPLRPGFVVVWFEGEEASAAVMAERLVFTLEVWVAAMAGRAVPRARRRAAAGALRARRAGVRADRALDPRPRRLGRRIRRRAVRAAAVVHLRRRDRPHHPLRRDPHAGARRRARRARRRGPRRRPGRVGAGPLAQGIPPPRHGHR